jgi:hypothetical protein
MATGAPPQQGDPTVTESFSRDIRPMFTAIDVDHMRRLGFLLDDFSFMSDPNNAQNVLAKVTSGQMPPPNSGENPWSPAQVQKFSDWMNGGYQP